MAPREKVALILDLKERGQGVAVVLRLERGGRKLTFTAGELQAKLAEHHIAWTLFVKGVNDFERWLDFPAHRKSFPEYIDSRLELLKRLKAQLKLESPKPADPPARAPRVANREPKKNVMRPTKRGHGIMKTLNTVRSKAKNHKEMTANLIRDFFVDMGVEVQKMK